jgi:hypothetical protein
MHAIIAALLGAMPFAAPLPKQPHSPLPDLFEVMPELRGTLERSLDLQDRLIQRFRGELQRAARRSDRSLHEWEHLLDQLIADRTDTQRLLEKPTKEEQTKAMEERFRKRWEKDHRTPPSEKEFQLFREAYRRFIEG